MFGVSFKKYLKMQNYFSLCSRCKGFFRRALKKADQYECINDNKCVINKCEYVATAKIRFLFQMPEIPVELAD